MRDQAIEAMAKAWVAYEGDEWDDINSRGMAAVKACVERELDALLDFLTEHVADLADWNAAECADDNEGCNCVSDEQVRGVLSVLRPVAVREGETRDA